MARAGRLFAGFDAGTGGLKGLLIDAERGRVVARHSASYGLIEGLPPGAAEQHPDTWIQALGEVGRRLFGGADFDPQSLAGIGVSGQQHGLVVLDERGRPLRAAKLWCDTSTAAEASELTRRLGRPVPAGYTAPKVLWLARHEPDTWLRTRRVLLPHDYLNYRLTGIAWSEAGDASGTGWFDPRARAVDGAACAAIDPGLKERLAPLFQDGRIAASLSAEGASLLGLPDACIGTPVSTGGGDNMMSAVGAGATREGVAVLSMGTSATVFAYSARPIVDPSGAIAPFCDSTGAWLPLLCVMNAAGALEDVRAGLGGTHADLQRQADRVAIDPEGPLCLPFFAGERVPDLPAARAALVGLSPGSLTPARIYRACMEGIALNLAAGIGRMRALGIDCHELRAVGGGAHNRAFLRILADAAGASVTPLVEAESAALGAALQAQWSVSQAAGEGQGIDEVARPWVLPEGEPIRPDPARVAAMARLGERFAALRTALYGV